MERQVITIQEECIIYAPHLGEVWMTAWEIAELFYVSGVTVKNTIKRIWKQGALKEFETYRYIKLDNGNSADVYNLEMVMAIAFQIDTFQAKLFREWIVGKIVHREQNACFQGQQGQALVIMMNDYKDFS
ncbi:hypothetical protein V7T14_14155 [Segatella copri]|uniref:hypothetical protein n=1 Tax=Segatella copri TaxID=165179 RepID=UPI001C440ECB|nr:hypothetical protein [Segatella copri]MBW0032419.1 hypothetical protein [Segatella copri]